MLLETTRHLSLEKNRYRDAKHDGHYVIDQDWESYSSEEHDRWSRLFARQKEIIKGRACDAVIRAMSELELSESRIPDMAILSKRLKALTGWEVVPVAELVPDDVFFNHLANRRFPAGAFIRPESEFDYLQEPDIFHDIFGHVPMLTDPTFADFMQAYGKGGQRALALGQLKNLARLYWYTVEFGLIQEKAQIKIFGAGILSSPKETVFSLDSRSPHRLHFDLERIMKTDYIIDDFQKTYFVIDSFQSLLESCYANFEDVYKAVKDQTDIAPHECLSGDKVLNQGSLQYFNQKEVVH